MSIARLLAYHTALNAFDLGAVEAMFAVDAQYISPGLQGAVQGRTAIMNAMRDYFAENADQHAEDAEIVELVPHVVRSRWSLSAISSKTGKVTTRHGTEVVTFNAAGLIQRVEVFDAD